MLFKMKMRNFLLISGFAALGLASCKKDFTCQCEVDGVYYIHYEYTHMSEEGATATCLADQTLAQQESGQNVQCHIQ